MSKLQLVDPAKLNEVLDLLKKDFDNHSLMRGISNVNEFQLREAQALMESKQGNPNKGEKMVGFLKKKERVKREHDGDANLDVETSVGKTKKTTPIETSKLQLMGFINKKKLYDANNDGSIKGSQINMDDFVYDLSHNAAKNFHVNKDDHSHALKILKKLNMPSGYIRNNMLRNKYISIGKKTKKTHPKSQPTALPLPSASESDDDGGDEFFYETRKKKKFSSF